MNDDETAQPSRRLAGPGHSADIQHVLALRLSCLLWLLAGICPAAEPSSVSVSNSPAAPRAAGYRGIWFTLGQFSEHGDKYSGGLGTYTANHTPLAIYAPAVEKTFFAYGGSPAGERHLLCMIGSYDHVLGRVERPVVVHDKGPVDDPHDNPSLGLDAAGHLWVFVSGRGTQRPGYIYRSAAPYDISRFEQIAEKEMTYPQPWFVPGRGFIHLFTRYTKGRELYFETSADGRDWSATRKLAGFGGHYQVSGRRGEKIGTFFNYHPGGGPYGGGSVDRRTNLYYMETRDLGATWTTAAGRLLALPISEVDNLALVANYAEQGELMYTCDLSFDPEGNPVLLYVLSRDYLPGPAGGKRRWTVAHWKGGAWRFSTVTTSDHNYDMGSLYVEPGEWRVIAPTDVGPQAWGTGGEMVLWVSPDEGRTWERRRAITSGSRLNHSYARRPVHARDPFYAFWADGDPGKLSESRLYFADSTGERVWCLPYTMKEDAALPAIVR